MIAGALLGLPVLWWLGAGRPVNYGALEGVGVVGDSIGADARYEDLALATTRGDSLHCMVRSPLTGSVERRPALLVAGGQRTGRRAVRLLGGYAGIAIACDYPWAGRVRRAWPIILASFPRLRAELLATPDVFRIATVYLVARPDVDTARIAAVGASLGVPPVAKWAADDPAPRAIALVYGGGHIDRQVEILLAEGRIWPWVRRFLANAAGRVFAPLEPTTTVRGIAPRPLLVIGSRDDQRIPAEGVQALFDAAGEPKRIIWLEGGHMRPRNEDLLALLADSSLAWLETTLPGRWRTVR